MAPLRMSRSQRVEYVIHSSAGCWSCLFEEQLVKQGRPIRRQSDAAAEDDVPAGPHRVAGG